MVKEYRRQFRKSTGLSYQGTRGMISRKQDREIYKDYFEFLNLKKELEERLKRVQWLRQRIQHLEGKIKNV